MPRATKIRSKSKPARKGALVSGDGSAWKRVLWAVEMTTQGRSPILIGETWDAVKPIQYDGQPTRALLFSTRRQARKWCAASRAKYRARSDTCADWRFVPVQVIETVMPND